MEVTGFKIAYIAYIIFYFLIKIIITDPHNV
jgi:hypothetical protein